VATEQPSERHTVPSRSSSDRPTEGTERACGDCTPSSAMSASHRRDFTVLQRTSTVSALENYFHDNWTALLVAAPFFRYLIGMVLVDTGGSLLCFAGGTHGRTLRMKRSRATQPRIGPRVGRVPSKRTTSCGQSL
jgi:hypothetical protein